MGGIAHLKFYCKASPVTFSQLWEQENRKQSCGFYANHNKMIFDTNGKFEPLYYNKNQG